MARPGPKPRPIAGLAEACTRYGSVAKASKALGVPERTARHRLKAEGFVGVTMWLKIDVADAVREDPYGAIEILNYWSSNR